MPNNINICPLPSEGFIRLPQVLQMFGCGKSKIWDLVKQGKFPAPKKLGSKLTVWDIQELREFQKEISARGSI